MATAQDPYLSQITDITAQSLGAFAGMTAGAVQQQVAQGKASLKDDFGVAADADRSKVAGSLNAGIAAAVNQADGTRLFPNNVPVVLGYIRGSGVFGDLNNNTEYCAVGIMVVVLNAIWAVNGSTLDEITNDFANGNTDLKSDQNIDPIAETPQVRANINAAVQARGGFPKFKLLQDNDVLAAKTINGLLAVTLKRVLSL